MRQRAFTAYELLILLALISIISAIAIPNLVASRKHRNEASAIGALKTIATSESLFREGDKENDGNLDYGMLSELVAANLVDDELGSGTKKGYTFEATYSYATSEFLWFARATPVYPTFSGERYFATNQAGVIFYTTGAAFCLDTNTCMLPVNGTIPS